MVGSVGPYGASLHDGSEYTGSYASTTPINTIRDWHIPRINALVEAGVDLLAIETIPCRAEAEMLAQLLKENYPSTKAWLSFSVAVSLKFNSKIHKTSSIILINHISKMANLQLTESPSKRQPGLVTT